MSVPYGMPSGSYPPASGGVSQPPGRVNYGWIGEAFELFKANAGIWTVAALLALIPAIVSQIIQRTSGHAPAVPIGPNGQPDYSNTGYWLAVFTGGMPLSLYFTDQIFSAVYGAYIAAGVYRTAVKQVRGEAIAFGDLFSGGRFLLPMLIFTFVYQIVVFVAAFLCLLPALLLAGLLLPCSALIADGEPLGTAVSRSWYGMKQDLWNAAGFAFVMGLLLVASFLACLLGEFVMLPMTYLVAALAYRDMVGMAGLNPPALTYGTAAGVWPPAPSATPPPQWGTAPAPPQQYPGYAPQPAPPSQPAPPPSWGTAPETPSWGTPAPAPEATSDPPTNPPEEPTANPWQPRPSPPPPPQGE